MAQLEVKRLDCGDLFPSMELNLIDDTMMALPKAAEGKWFVLLAYRGRW